MANTDLCSLDWDVITAKAFASSKNDSPAQVTLGPLTFSMWETGMSYVQQKI